MKVLKTIVLVIACLLESIHVSSAQTSFDIISLNDGQITWTNSDPHLYYSIEWVASPAQTTNWTGSYRGLQDLRATDQFVTVTIPTCYRVIGHTQPAHTRTLAVGTDTVSAGYYEATTLRAVDANLSRENIRAGVTIFGIPGQPEVVDTSSGNASAGEILTGRKAWAGGMEVTGTMESRMLSDTSDTVAAGYYAATHLTEVDPDLAPGNIASNVVLFGITGTLSTNREAYPASIPKTGQTTAYLSGDDGTYQQGVVWPNPRFTVGTGISSNCATDNLTGLMWLKNPDATVRTWTNTMLYCEGLDGNNGRGGHTDWRMPNIRELQSLADYGRSIPALPAGHPFTGYQTGGTAYYWSSTTLAGRGNIAFILYLDEGRIDYGYKTSSTFVWPVRGP